MRSLALSHNKGFEADSKRSKRHWLLRYGFALGVFAVVIALATLLSYLFPKINQTIPIVFAVVAVAWYAGRGPGLLLGVLLEATTIIYVPIPPESSILKGIFGYFSTLALYAFLVLVISGLREIQQRLAEQRDMLHVTLSSIGEAVIATDTIGRVTFMNPVAQKMTGWRAGEAHLLPLEKIVRIISEDTRKEVTSPVAQVLETGKLVGMQNHSLLIARDGGEIPIADTAAPITDNGELKGVVMVFADVTEQKRAERSRRESEIMQRLVEAQESERHRIARDLHDHLGQRMTALRLQIEGLADQCDPDAPLKEALGEVQTSASRIDRDIGYLSWELRPTELEDLGLVDALNSFVREWSRQHDIEAEFHSNITTLDYEDGRLAHSNETNFYRIVQEALNNVLKHADATNVSVLLHRRKNLMVLIIEDDGLGFDSNSSTFDEPKLGHLGLIGMRERAAVMNGTLEIDSQPGSGTTVLAKIPIETDADALAVSI
jgi:PAS domain S-box-containing protein